MLCIHLRFIERALEYDLKIWLDLMANYNNHLGQLQEYGWEITSETAKYVVKQIAKKYDPRVCHYPLFTISQTKTLGYNSSYGPS
jgi:aryl-phospho-beta-D-glucosidase BglC (GH1 family)